MIFKNFGINYFKKNNLELVQRFYYNIVNLARNPDLYKNGGIPDTIDGRFELIVLHAHFFIKKLLNSNQKEKEFAQNLIDFMIRDFDLSLREIGVGDLSVGKKVKHMVSSYYGRVKVYDENISDFNGKFVIALKNNLYGTTTPTDMHLKFILKYIESLTKLLNKIEDSNFLKCFDNFNFVEELYHYE
tara:strand:+ start:8967 stop:9527 length:561 start_codon:yes stop_codon:yes gene_type:complete